MLNYETICDKIRRTTKTAKSQDAKINAVKRAFKKSNHSDSCEYHVEPRHYFDHIQAAWLVDVVVYKKLPSSLELSGFVDMI